VLQHVSECCNTYRDSKRNNSEILFHGWLVENSSWRWVFFVNLPFALIVVVNCREEALALIERALKEDPRVPFIKVFTIEDDSTC
jgi:MFS family permease